MDRCDSFHILPPIRGAAVGPRQGRLQRAVQDLTRTRTPAMQEIFAKAARVAPTRTTVLLTGETGVGKGTIATARARPFQPRGQALCLHPLRRHPG